MLSKFSYLNLIYGLESFNFISYLLAITNKSEISDYYKSEIYNFFSFFRKLFIFILCAHTVHVSVTITEPYLSIYLSVYLSDFLFFCLSVCLSISVCLCGSL